MPAYSQSTITSRSPSSMKFALSRSLWHARGGWSARNSAIRRASSCAEANASGTTAPRSTAVSRYASTTSSPSNLPGIAGPWWKARSARATRRSCSGSRSLSGGGIDPSTKRVTSHPSGSTKSTTSGPTPTSAAARVAASSTVRSMPSRSVSFPATRSTTTPSGRVTLTLWLVIPPPSTSHVDRPSGQTRATASASASLMRGPSLPSGRRAAPRPRRPPPTRRRSRPPPRCRRRAPPEGTRRRSTRRPCSRSRRS